MVLTGAELLRHNGHEAPARAIEAAVTAAIHAGETTRDLGGTLGTRACGEAVLARLAAG
jgi:3-isopropylmalate dehydrogenase